MGREEEEEEVAGRKGVGMEEEEEEAGRKGVGRKEEEEASGKGVGRKDEEEVGRKEEEVEAGRKGVGRKEEGEEVFSRFVGRQTVHGRKKGACPGGCMSIGRQANWGMDCGRSVLGVELEDG